MQMQGTTPVVTQEADFIVSDDPWFRPVDVKLGPDGALYVADFYNSIIGHYEVPLDHPARDRQRGRIWRIVYTGHADPPSAEPRKDWSKASLDDLVMQLSHPQLPLRMAIADQIVDRYASEATSLLKTIIENEESDFRSVIQALWILYRLDELPERHLQVGLNHANDTVRVHALRVLFEYDQPSRSLMDQARILLAHRNPHVVRQAVMVLSQHPTREHLTSLLSIRNEANHDDTHLFYSIRQALRNQIRDPLIRQWMLGESWDRASTQALMDVVVGVDHADASTFIQRHLGEVNGNEEKLLYTLMHAARYAETGGSLTKLVEKARALLTNTDMAIQGIHAIEEGSQAAALDMPQRGREWAALLVDEIMAHDKDALHGWSISYHPLHRPTEGNWQWIDTTFGQEKIRLLASDREHGTNRTSGILRSPDFPMPAELQFVVRAKGEEASHEVQLRVTGTDSIVERMILGDPDFFRAVSWQAEQLVGRNMYLLVLDGSADPGASIAIGAMDDPPWSWPALAPKDRTARMSFAMQSISKYNLGYQLPIVKEMLGDKHEDVLAVGQAARAGLHLRKKEISQTIKGILSDTSISPYAADILLLALAEDASKPSIEVVEDFLHLATYQTEKEVIRRLSGSADGVEYIMRSVESSELSPKLLLDKEIQEVLQLHMSRDQQAAFLSMTRDLKKPHEEIQNLINNRVRGYALADANTQRGGQMQVKHCSSCHSLDGHGGNIGPQLDGIGHWGARALTEKILDPNRNISQAFVNYNVKTKDGKVLRGLLRREEGNVLVFADVAGREFSISKDNIIEKSRSPYTLMPDHFGQVIPEKDFYDLLAFLLRVK